MEATVLTRGGGRSWVLVIVFHNFISGKPTAQMKQIPAAILIQRKREKAKAKQSRA